MSLASLVGTPYAEQDCWAIVRQGLKLEHGIDIPAVNEETQAGWRAAELRKEMQRDWKVVTGYPKAGDILVMKDARRRLHVALALDPVRVLHSSQDAGSAVIQRRRDLPILGFGEAQVWRHRRYWDDHVSDEELTLEELPAGRETVRGLLQVVVFADVTYFTANPGAGLAAANAVAGAFNLLVPPRTPNINDQTPSGIYSAALAGNVARLDQPIQKNCGHCRITPPFAAIPYSINLPRKDAANPRLDTEQYGYFLYCVGMGDHEVVRTFIGKTPLSSFQDIILAQYLAPGEQPTMVEPNVLTSTEVVELELATDINGNGIYVGGYVGCRPRDRVTKVGIDVSAPQGLGHITTGGSQDLVVAWQVDVREIDDFGVPLGEWVPIGNEEEEFDTNSAQRWSNEYELSAPMRCEVRVFRTNQKNYDSDARDQINWAAMRCWLEAPATLNPKAAHFELVIRASKQLSQESQRDFSMLVNGMSPIWDPGTGWTGNVVHRNPAWWLVDLWKDPDWGEGKEDHEIDLMGMWQLAQTYDARQDHFDFSFATSVDAAEAAQIIARAGRARASEPLGIRTATRDELVTEHQTMFSARNTQPNSIVMSEDLPTRDRPDAIILTYQDHKRGDLQEIIEWLPGADPDSVGDPANPLFVQLDGVIGATHARREARAMAFKAAYRGVHYQLTTEMEGFMLRHMDVVRVMPDLPEYGITGDVTYFDPATLALELSEPVDFSQAPLYITLRRDDGSITDPVEVTAGVNPTTVYLPALPDFEIVTDDGGRERPVFFLGAVDTDELCKIEEIADGGVTSAEDGEEGGAQLFDITMVVDDPRVHLADNDLLPSPGEIQDPIDDGTFIPSEAGNTAALVRLSPKSVIAGEAEDPGGRAEFTLGNNGQATGKHAAYADLPTLITETYPAEWITSAPVELSVASLYEVYAEDFGTQAQAIAGGATATGPVNTWVPLSSTRTWVFEADPTTYSGPLATNVSETTATIAFRMKIRRIGSTVIQAVETISLVLVIGPGGGGGD